VGVPANFAFHRVGDSSTVEQRTLTPSILVRIQVPQPPLFDIAAFYQSSFASKFVRHVRRLLGYPLAGIGFSLWLLSKLPAVTCER
jgi:hypothetical protein